MLSLKIWKFYQVTQSERAETIDIVRYLLSYAYGSPVSYLKDKELTDSAVRNILAEFVSFSGFPQTSSYAESTARQNTLGSRPPGQNIEMKRGDWICTRYASSLLLSFYFLVWTVAWYWSPYFKESTYWMLSVVTKYIVLTITTKQVLFCILPSFELLIT